MFVANIVTKNKLNIDKYFNVVDSIDGIIEDLPTLVIGWDIVKTINPDVDFIDKKISKNIFWTFKKTERRDIFEEDLYNFIHYSYNLLIRNIKYKFVDTIQMTDNELKTTFKIIKEYKKSIAYLYGKMLYVYTENNIYGIDLNLLKYMGFDYNKTITKIKSDSLVFLDNEEILIEYKDIIDMLNNEVKYVPYLYSIEHG